jgi:hypothetical protein
MKNLFNNQGITKRMFRKVEGLVWDIMSGKIGIQSKGGFVTLETSGEGTEVVYRVNENLIDVFGMPIPAFAINTPNADINIGDLIVGAKGILGFVVKKNAASLVILKEDGQQTVYTPVKTQVFGLDGYMVVKSLTGLLGTEGAAGLQGSLLPLLMLGGDSGTDLDNILPLLLMQGQGQTQGGVGFNLQSALPLLLMSKGGLGGSGSSKMKDLLPLLMMSGGLGGANGGGMAAMLPLMLMGGFGDDEDASAKPVELPVKNGIPALTRNR